MSGVPDRRRGLAPPGPAARPLRNPGFPRMPGVLRQFITLRIVDPVMDQIISRFGSRIVTPQNRPGAAPRSDTPTNREYVLWAYRLLLGREPEEPDQLEHHVYAADHDSLVREFLSSAEFRNRNIPCDKIFGEAPAYLLAELADGLRFWVNLRDEHVSRGIIAGMWEPAETAFIDRYIETGMNVVDIGANLGWFTVRLSRRVGASGHVTSFEPRNDLFHYLSRTVAENKLDNVTLHNCALGAQDGEANVYWAKSDLNPGGTHLVPDDLDPAGLAEGYAVQKIGMRSLDRVIHNPVDFIKIDVEGAELLVFEGASRILQADRPLILSEIAPESLEEVSHVSASEYVDYFSQRNYTVREIDAAGGLGPVFRVETLRSAQDIRNVVLVPNERDQR